MPRRWTCFQCSLSDFAIFLAHSRFRLTRRIGYEWLCMREERVFLSHSFFSVVWKQMGQLPASYVQMCVHTFVFPFSFLSSFYTYFHFFTQESDGSAAEEPIYLYISCFCIVLTRESKRQTNKLLKGGRRLTTLFYYHLFSMVFLLFFYACKCLLQ
jgi:hypothetical protein